MDESVLPKLDDFDTSAIGPIKGTHGQQIIDALRKLDRAQGYDGSKPHPYWDFLETWPAIVVGLNAPGYQSEADPPKPIPSMYWVQKCYVGDGETADLVNFYPAQDDPNQYYPATNVLEMTAPPNTGGTSQVQMGQPVLVMVYIDRGVTNRKRYLFIADRPIVWIRIGTPMPATIGSNPTGGGGYYNATLYRGAPVTIDPTTDLVAPITPNEALGPANAILAMNWAETNLGDPPSHWVEPDEDVPAWFVGYSNETPPRPCYRFYVPQSRLVNLVIIAALGTPGAGGGGRYKTAVMLGAAIALDTTTDFKGMDNGTNFPTTFDSYWTDLYEAGTGTNGTCVIDVGYLVRGSFVGIASDGKPAFYGSSAPAGTTFAVRLTVASGYNTPPAFQYSATTLGGLPLTASGAYIAPDFRPSGGSKAATAGLGYLDGTGVFKLKYADEQSSDLWGTLTYAWSPGSATVTLTPCAGPTNNAATGAANVTVYLSYPFARVANWCGFSVGDIAGYVATGAVDGGGNPIYRMVHNPPPTPTAQYQGIFNSSSDPTKPNFIADYARLA